MLLALQELFWRNIAYSFWLLSFVLILGVKELGQLDNNLGIVPSYHWLLGAYFDAGFTWPRKNKAGFFSHPTVVSPSPQCYSSLELF